MDNQLAEQYAVLLTLLTSLEDEMKRVGLWSDTQPSAGALQSQQPFCVDTLAFEEWLQFIMIPRFQQMSLSNAPLPAQSDVSTMAEHVLIIDQHESVLKLIKAIDGLFTVS